MKRALALLALASRAFADEPVSQPAPIADEGACKTAHGRWGADDEGLTGCTIGDKREGLWRDYWPSGAIKSETTYVHGAREGKTATWQESCLRQTEGAYHDDKIDGQWTYYDREGHKQAVGTWAKGVKQGTWDSYVEAQKVLSGPYVDGKAEGTFQEWFATGETWRSAEFKNDKRAGTEDCEKGGGSWTIDYVAREEGCTTNRKRTGTWHGYWQHGAMKWEREYKNGQIDGNVRELHETGTLLREGKYVKDIPDGAHVFHSPDGNTIYGASNIVDGAGSWQAFYSDGKPSEMGTFDNHLKNGEWITWFANGNKDTDATYVKGSLEGPTQSWFDTGELKVEGQNRGGYRDGKWNAYYKNGKLAWQGAYDEGRRTGAWKDWSYAGVLQTEGPFAADARTGHWIEYYEDGPKKAEGEYADDARTGSWQFYWPSGEEWRTAEYVDGVPQDEAEASCEDDAGTWDEDGLTRTVGCNVCRWSDDDQSVNTVKDGIWTWWHPNGAVEKKGKMQAEEQAEKWTWWFDNGKVMLEGEYRGGTPDGNWVGSYRDGGKRFKTTYHEGEIDGPWTAYHPNGNKMEEGRFDKGQRAGHWVYFYLEGAKKDEGEFVAGVEQGVWTSWWPDGKKEGEGAFKDGLREGDWTWWRDDGTPWHHATYSAGQEDQPSTQPPP